MDKKYAILLLVFFVAIIAMSGCSTKPKTTTTTASAAFVGGNDGIAISLLPGQPPSQIFTKQQFQISVQVENKGEGKLSPLPFNGAVTSNYGYLSLSGIDVTRFNLSDQTPYNLTMDLPSVNKIGSSIVPGGQTQVPFIAGAPDIVGAAAQFPLRVALTYQYASKAVSSVCIKQSAFQQTVAGKEICTLTGAKAVEAAGAPIRVVSVDELPTGFNIKIKNVGPGYPFRANATTFQQTEGAIDQFNEKDRVQLASVKLGTQELKEAPFGCTPKELYVYNGEASFFCTTMNTTETDVKKKNLLGRGSEYVEQLTIELSYGYASTTSTTLNIQGTGGQ